MNHDWEFLDMPGKPHHYCHRCGEKWKQYVGCTPPAVGECTPDWAWHEAQRYKAQLALRQGTPPATEPGKPAGNSYRHHDPSESFYGAIPEPDLSAMWDRLAADLSQCGTPAPLETVTYTGVSLTPGVVYEVTASDGSRYEMRAPEPDYDAILLASHKRREERSAFFDDLEARPLFSKREAIRKAEEAKARPIVNAFDRPIAFTARMGGRY